MAFSTPSYGQGGSYTAAQDRGLNMGHARTPGVRRLIPAAVGIMQGDLAVSSTGTTNGSVVVALGDCFIDDGTGTGLYFSTNATSTVTVGPFAANSSGATRNDLVYVLVTDSGVGSPTIAATIASGSITVPAKAIGLATIAIPNGFTTTTQVQNAWITDVRKKAQVFDYTVTTTSAVASPLSGNLVFDTSTSPNGKLKIYNTAGTWEQVATTNGSGFTNADMATGYTMLYQNATAPSSPTDGQLWYDSTNDVLYMYRVSDTTWVEVVRTTTSATWTPQMYQNANVSTTINDATYSRQGRWITGTCIVTAAATSGGAGEIRVYYNGATPLPTPRKTGLVVGAAQYLNSGSAYYTVAARIETNYFRFTPYGFTTGVYLGTTSGAGTGFTMASGDSINFTFAYEATS